MNALHGDSTLTEYMDRVRRIPRLSREDEHDLAVRVKAGDRKAADALIEANLRFVVAMALQYRRYGIPIWELIAEGSLGLMLAVGKFDPERRLELLAGRFNVEPEKARSMLQQIDARDISLDMQVRPDSGVTMLDTLRDEAQQEHTLIEGERLRLLRDGMQDALAELDQRERYIVEQRILNDDELSLAELGRRLGVSRERARQLEARAKRKLRDKLQALHLDAA